MPTDETLIKEKVLRLQDILGRKNGRTFSYEETEQIGRGLLNIYSNLADNELGIGLIIKSTEENENGKIT
jgi:hypothetical protein